MKFSAFNEASAIALALAHTLPSSFCQRHQSRWQISDLSWMALAGRLTNERLIMVGGTIVNGKYKHISTAFAACQQVTRFQVSKCDCISQHINHKVIVLSKCLLLVQFLPRTCSVQTSIRLALLVCATLPTRRISKPVSAGLLDREHIRVK